MFTKFVERANEIIYHFPSGDIANPSAVRTWPDFQLTVFAYSSIGSGDLLDVSFSRKECTRRLPGVDNVLGQPGPDQDVEDDRRDVFDDDGVVGVDVDDDDSEYVGANHSSPSAETENGSDGASSESDDEDSARVSKDHSHDETVPPSCTTGTVTNVSIVRQAQLRRIVRKWKYASSVPIHDSTTDNTPRDRDLKSYAKRSLLALRNAGDLCAVSTADLPHEITKLENYRDVDFDSHPLPELTQGWARRPRCGKMYGAKYMQMYAGDIREMFDQGAAVSSMKLGAGRMLEELRQKYPDRYNLPSESEIRAEISKLFASTKKRKAADQGNPDPRKRAKTPMPEIYTQYLEQLVQEKDVMPLEALSLFKKSFPDWDSNEVPPEKIRAKVSALKRQKLLRQSAPSP